MSLQVSYPGDAISNPQTRRGKWKSRQISAPTGWRFAVAEASHEVTNSRYQEEVLSGEKAGRQIWYQAVERNETPIDVKDIYFNPGKNPNSADQLLRKTISDKWKGEVPDRNNKPNTAKESVSKAISFYQMIQCEDGHWAGDYGGPMFLMPGLICVLYLTKTPFPAGRREAMTAYIRNHQQDDGGWGTHIECASTMFGTVLNYVALRLLGDAADEPHMLLAKEFIHHHGGALYAPSWAKFWLAAIGVYEWEGVNSVPVEMWFLPRWFIFHPGKLWCHCRMVYLPMGYVYCSRFKPDVSKDPVLQALRKELYPQNYDTIRWDDFRQTCAPIDEYSPLNPVMKVAQDALAIYERYYQNFNACKNLRKAGLDYCLDYIHAEDIQTNYIDIGPVNKALNMLAVWVGGGCDNNNPDFKKHMARVDDYLWVAEDGMKMQGYNGSQCWDTAFAIQAIAESGLAQHYPDCLRKAYSYFDRTQIKNDEENREYYFRHISKGGWPFSTAAHGWPISDCTAEGLKAVITLHRLHDKYSLLPGDKLISKERLKEAVDVILSYQNFDGGWATYENNRGYGWYELLNPSEVFGDIMIDYSYVECTSACVTALKHFQHDIPDYRADEIKKSMRRARNFLKSIQRSDGSWYGSWGNCFNYGTWFGVEGLIAAGEPIDSFSIRRAINFFLSKQNPNGGWGESYLACVNKAYPADGAGTLGDGNSGVVQTAWALLGLLAGDCTNHEAMQKAKNFLMSKQVRKS